MTSSPRSSPPTTHGMICSRTVWRHSSLEHAHLCPSFTPGRYVRPQPSRSGECEREYLAGTGVDHATLVRRGTRVADRPAGERPPVSVEVTRMRRLDDDGLAPVAAVIVHLRRQRA